MQKATSLLAIVLSVIALGCVFQTPKSGNITSPDIYSPYLAVNGVTNFFSVAYPTAATTTPFTVKTPNATSTLAIGSGCRVSVSSTTASRFIVASASTPNATTTLLFGANIAAGAQATVVASTSLDAFVLAPNSYVNVGMSGGNGTFSPSGSCRFTFLAY